MTTPIRETIARAILYDLDEHSAAYVGFDADKMDEARVDGDCDFLSAADAVLRALDEAGCVVVRKEASDAMVEAHMGECAGDADEAGPDRIRGAWSAMISASVVE